MNESDPTQKAEPPDVEPRSGDDIKDAVAAQQQFWLLMSPTIKHASDVLIAAVERSTRHTGQVTGCLLALIIVCLTGLAFFSLYIERVDTAEKIVIAMVSFLGGAQMFSGPPKK